MEFIGIIIGIIICIWCVRFLYMKAKEEEKGIDSVKMKEESGKTLEYKRQCRMCGRIWYSLALREAELEKEMKYAGKMASLETIGGLGRTRSLAAAGQQKKNEIFLQKELGLARTCPDCKSANYVEEEVLFQKQDHAETNGVQVEIPSDHDIKSDESVKRYGPSNMWRCVKCQKLLYSDSVKCYSCGGSIDDVAERVF